MSQQSLRAGRTKESFAVLGKGLLMVVAVEFQGQDVEWPVEYMSLVVNWSRLQKGVVGVEIAF